MGDTMEMKKFQQKGVEQKLQALSNPNIDLNIILIEGIVKGDEINFINRLKFRLKWKMNKKKYFNRISLLYKCYSE